MSRQMIEVATKKPQNKNLSYNITSNFKCVFEIHNSTIFKRFKLTKQLILNEWLKRDNAKRMTNIRNS